MEPRVYFDESGNSGGNLLDQDQPIFVLASVHLADEDISSVLAPSAREYKFATLKQSESGRELIVHTLDSAVVSEDNALVSGFHKRFMIVTKIVDMLVEPLLHGDGIDLYDRGANLGMSNLYFYTLPVFLGKDVFATLLERFVAMVRRPSDRSIQKFYALLETALRKHRKEGFAKDIAMLLATRAIAEESRGEWDGSDLDPAIPAFVQQASIWTGRFNAPFRIVHDSAKPIQNEQLVLEAMMSATDERREIGYDRRKMTFPISATGIDFQDSTTSLQVQLADLIAGAAAHCLKARLEVSNDPFARALASTRALSGSFHPVWPELKVTPDELGTAESDGTEAADYIGAYVSKRLGGIPPKGQRRKTI